VGGKAGGGAAEAAVVGLLVPGLLVGGDGLVFVLEHAELAGMRCGVGVLAHCRAQHDVLAQGDDEPARTSRVSMPRGGKFSKATPSNSRLGLRLSRARG
jgi:hypothetical protein